MAHEFESGFFVREKAWHGLGTVVQEAPTSADALHLAGLDWKVIQKPVFTDNKEIPFYKANVRDSDNSVLGIVSDRYKIVQNTDAFDFTDSLVGGDVHYETAGSLKNGRTIWLLAKMPNTTILGDEIEPYMCFTNNHDGSGAIRVCLTPVRVVCNNTLNLALSSAKRSWSTKHIGNIEAKMREAKHTLGLAYDYMDGLAKEADVLAHSKISTDEISKILDEMFPIVEDASERQKANVKKAREEIYMCYLAPDIEKFIGTKYGFINAVADWCDHATPARLTESYAENNWGRIIDGHPILDKAYELVMAKA